MPDSPEEAAKKMREFMLEMQTAAYSRAAAYTNLITLGGFAGAFTLWSFTRPHLTPKVTIAVALLLGVFLSTFVFFEIYRMLATSKAFLKQRALLADNLKPEEFLRRVQGLARQQQEDQTKWQIPIWVAVWIICVSTALLAVSILFYNFFLILIS